MIRRDRSMVGVDRHPLYERPYPLPWVIRLLKELVGEIGVAEHAIRVQGVAEGKRASKVPALAHALDGLVRLALEGELDRCLLEGVPGKVVVSPQERGKDADQPHIPICVVEYQGDGE